MGQARQQGPDALAVSLEWQSGSLWNTRKQWRDAERASALWGVQKHLSAWHRAPSDTVVNAGWSPFEVGEVARIIQGLWFPDRVLYNNTGPFYGQALDHIDTGLAIRNSVRRI